MESTERRSVYPRHQLVRFRS